MFGESRVAIHYVSFPKDWRQVLRSSPDGGGGGISSIILDLEEIFGLSEVNDFDVTIIQKKQICWFQISVAETNTLHVSQSGYQRHYHFLHFHLFPEKTHLFALAKDILKILLMLNILTYNSNSESIIHGFIEKITVELNNIRMVLSFE